MNPPCPDAEEEDASRPQEPAPAPTETNYLPPETTKTNLSLAPGPVTMERNESHVMVVSRALTFDLTVFEIELEVQCFLRRGNLAAFRSNDARGGSFRNR